MANAKITAEGSCGMQMIDTLELVYDHLISKRINGVMFDSPVNGSVVIVNRNSEDFPIVLAWISAVHGKLHVRSPVLREEPVNIFSSAPDDDFKIIDLVDPDSLDQLVVILEGIEEKYNELAIRMELFGSSLIAQSEFHVRLAPFQMYRPIPKSLPRKACDDFCNCCKKI